ncbi:MAG TPA: N,N-dimethylformamidase beta subunit family domain-containing protein [Flavitalea sp.]|nr:N,N-dimethylformamidase beta subunit family domain-containing protein [Flavitalea sp.]
MKPTTSVLKHLIVCLSLLNICCNKPFELVQPVEEVQTVIPITGYVDGDSYVVNGYMGKLSYFTKDNIDTYISAKSVLRKARLGVYNASGVLVDYIYCDSIIPQSPVGSKPYETGFGYKKKSLVKLTTELKSGIYTISKKIPFLIKSTIKSNQVLVLYPTNTVNAYNKAGGAGSYSVPRAFITSYQRPAPILYFNNEFIKWNSTPYAFDYITDFDLESYDSIKNYKMIIIIGHNEYWTRNARINFDRFINAGKHALILSGNTAWWQVRYSADKTQMICYKDVVADPEPNPLLKTIKWTSTSLQMKIIPSIGADFSLGGYGTKTDSGWNGYKILVPLSPILAGTGLAYESIVSCPTREYDGTYVIRTPGKPHPILDTAKLKFYKAELLGYDLGAVSKTTVATFIAFQKTATSGKIINVGSTNWCSTDGFGGTSGVTIKRITANSIDLLMNNQNIFSPAIK